MVDEFTFTPEYTTEALQNVMDLRGPVRRRDPQHRMPPSFVILDRVVWGVSALLGRLERRRNRWRGILDEDAGTGAPATELGELERGVEGTIAASLTRRIGPGGVQASPRARRSPSVRRSPWCTTSMAPEFGAARAW
ncbi:MAG: hypothetical protein R2699_19415 [Acidimicrobiales bacterium]